MSASHGLPDFVGIGALKAGTTYLDALLRTHPDICMPTVLKEVQFFTQHYERGAKWYAEQFHCHGNAVRGEISPQYLIDPNVPPRMAALIPAARLILSVREPIERTYSQYKHFIRDTGYAGDFEAFLAEHPGAIERSRYWSLLRRYLDYYPAEQVFIVVFEDIVGPSRDLSPMFRFLGVSDAHVPTLQEDRVNVSERPRLPRLYIRSKRISRWLYAHGYGRVVHTFKRSLVMRLYTSDKGNREFAAPLRSETAARLAQTYEDEVGGLSTFLGRDLTSVWPRFDGLTAAHQPN